MKMATGIPCSRRLSHVLAGGHMRLQRRSPTIHTTSLFAADKTAVKATGVGHPLQRVAAQRLGLRLTRLERSLEEVLNQYSLPSVPEISQPTSDDDVDVLESIVALTNILDPEETDDMPSMLTNFPELLSVPADTLVHVFHQLTPLPSCYSSLEATLLAARVAPHVPDSHLHQVTQLAVDFHAVYNSCLPSSLPPLFRSSSISIPVISQRAVALAQVMSLEAALSALSQHPYLLDYETEKLEGRLELLQEILDLEAAEARQAVGKEPALLLLTAPMVYQRLDELADKFGLTAGQMKAVVLQEPGALVADLAVMAAKWKCLTALSFQDVVWQAEVQHGRSAFLALVNRCTLCMLERFVEHIQGGEKLPGAVPLMVLLQLEFQYWQERGGVEGEL